MGRPGDVSTVHFDAFGSGVTGSTFEFELVWTERGTPPEIELAAHEPLLEFGKTLILSATASDSDQGVNLVEFFDNGTLIPGCSFSSEAYECEWTPDMGLHDLRAMARDESGNAALSTSR